MFADAVVHARAINSVPCWVFDVLALLGVEQAREGSVLFIARIRASFAPFPLCSF